MPIHKQSLGLLAAALLTVTTTSLVVAQTPEDPNLERLLAAAQNRTRSNLDQDSTGFFRDAVISYIYGYSLVAMAMTERVATTIPDATTQLGRAPINQLYRATGLPVGSGYKDVVLPSTTTLYAPSFMDLSKEPMILHIPQIESNRFFIVELLDGWTNVNRDSPGSRIGTTAGDYALVGPNYTGTLPAGLTGEIDFDTNTVWAITRVYTTGAPDDVKLVADNIFKELTLTPASEYGHSYTPLVNLPVNPSIDVTTQPIKQTDSLDACTFFGIMSAMMRTNPPRAIDVGIVKRLNRLGIMPPNQFSCAGLLNPNTPDGKSQLAALELAVLTAKQIMAETPPPALTPTNWTVSLDVGDYGTRYLLRALVAQKALGANRPQDAVYGYGIFDSRGTADDDRLNGTRSYVIHFNAPTNSHAPLEIPPIDGNGFWSLTLYQGDGTLNDNKVATYNALSTKPVQDHQACPNADGSLDIYVSATPPSNSQAFCNWLEAPQPGPDNDGSFIMFLRLYWPDSAVTNRRNPWYPPAIVRTN
jgi:hypothetical protein